MREVARDGAAWARLGGGAPILLALVTFGTAASAGAATVTVTSLADNLTVDGQVTLREAIVAANTNTSVDGSTPGSGPDDIVFATGPGTIVLSGAQLPKITESATVVGPGASVLALDGAMQSRIFEVASGVTLQVSGLTLRNGRLSGNGGAIYSAGTLVVSDSVFSANMVTADGGAISSLGGTLALTNDVFTGNSAQNGAAIHSTGNLQVLDSTFDGNLTGAISPFAGGGGAILFSGTGSITRSTFSNNSAGNAGALLYSGGATLTLTNCTVSGNRAANFGGGISSLGTLNLRSSTVVHNRANTDNDATGDGGGLYVVSGSVTVHQSIVADNASTSGNPSDILGTVQSSSSYNLIGVDTGLTGITNGANGNQIGTAGSPILPVLGPLQDNGGRTATRAVRPGSAAIDAIPPAACLTATDQRGVSRPLDGNADAVAACDVGAYEAFTVGSPPADYFTVTPCRLVDTRNAPGPTGGPALGANATRFFPVGGGTCGVPADARAVALDVGAVGGTTAGNIRLFPAGGEAPGTSSVNYSALQTRTNNAVVPLGVSAQVGARATQASGTVHLVLDVAGYFK